MLRRARSIADTSIVVERIYATNFPPALNLRNAPNRLPARRLQQMLGGEYHENYFCTCWPRRTWRGCFVQRGRIRGADRRPDLDDGNRRTGRLRLQRMGPLLAPPLRRWRLLPSALLGWLRLASALGWRLGWWLRLASLASLLVIAEKGAPAPFFFRRTQKCEQRLHRPLSFAWHPGLSERSTRPS